MKKKQSEFHILIIDDDKDDHFFFTNALQDLQLSGFTKDKTIKVTSLYSGIKGIDFLLKRGAYKDSPETTPNFVVLDLFMPVVDGYSVLHEIRSTSKLKNIPVYILTSSESENRKRCLAGGCSGFFSKPPDVEQLKNVIIQMFNHFK